MMSRIPICAGLLIQLICLPVFAKLTKDQVETLVKSESKWAARSGLTVRVNDNDVTISVYKDANSQDKDLKIDSVLITRKVMESDPDVKRVELRFYDSDRKHYEQVVVRQTDVAAFSSGVVTEDALLGGIDIEKRTDVSESTEGPFETERIQAHKHIEALRKQGVGVAAFMQLLSDSDELARKIHEEPKGTDADDHTKELRGKLDSLMRAFDEHAARVKKQNEVRLAKTLAANPTKPTAAANGGARGGAGGRGTQSAPAAMESDSATGLEKLGAFSPFPGPYLLDRIYIARGLLQAKKHNMPVSHLVPVWYRMETAVKTKNDVQVKTEVDYLQKQLGLQPLTDQQRRDQTVIQIRPF